jgi:type II secretory pathway component PulF
MFSARLSLTDLIDLCRVLKHQLAAGISIHQVLKQQAERGRRSFRAIAGRLSEAIQRGVSFSDALDGDRAAFPPLFLAMVKLGENTGQMAEIFGEMERYYQLELQLRRQFRSQTFLPKVQFVFATLIVAGLTWLLGFIFSMNNGVSPLTFFGLGGAAGALAFLGIVYGPLAAIWILFRTVANVGRQKVWMDCLLLHVPAIGPCLTALVMSRFTLALQLTLDTGLSIAKALRLSLEATGNAFYSSRADGIVLSLKNGVPLHEALQASGLFTSDFLEMVVSAEEGGSVPEMMKHLAEQYQDETRRKMTMLAMVAGGAVWFSVAGFIIWAIFRLYAIYFEQFKMIR